MLLFVLPAFAQAPGEPETVLAGIDLHHTPIASVAKLYGEPEGVYAAPEPYPVGTKQYKWGRLTVTLMVLTQPTSSGDNITTIQIQGEGDQKPISRTGRGLKLSDKADVIKKLYGVEPAAPSTTIKWASGEELIVHLNDKSRVDRLQLGLSSSPK
jgi:hypothetical protein